MMAEIKLEEIIIRTEIKTGDLGYIVHRHGKLYGKEYHYGISFEMYVAAGAVEFYKQYNPALDRLWICEHQGKTVGSLLLMHRGNNAAQLRYFLLEPEYRNIGLGKKLMVLFKEYAIACGYKSAYLWTTNEQLAAAALYIKNGFVLCEERESVSFGKPLLEQRYEVVM